MVGQVEQLAADLQFEALAEPEILEEREIEVRKAGASNRAAAGVAVAEGVHGRRYECSDVEILHQRPLVGRQLRRGQLVGPARAAGIYSGADQARGKRRGSRQSG